MVRQRAWALGLSGLCTLPGVNELDVLLRDHVTPVLRAEGFEKSAHTYRLALPGGDWITVSFRDDDIGTWGNFLVTVAFVPQPLLELQNWLDGRALEEPPGPQPGFWDLALGHPDFPWGWSYDSDDERRHCIDVLTGLLPRAVRVLRSLADRDVLLDVVRAPVGPVSPDLRTLSRLRGGAGGFRMALLTERGPSEALQPFLDFYAAGTVGYDRWATARLEAGRPLAGSLADVPQPRSTASYEPLQEALDAALDRFVTPAMAEAGFSRAPGGYERTTTAGDRAAVDVRLSATATEEALAFTVVTGLDVAPSREFRRAQRPVQPDSARLASVNPSNCSVSWLVSQLHPTPPFTSSVPALAELGLHPWSVPADRMSEGMGLLARTLAEANAPFLTGMLDRRALAEFLQDPAADAYTSAWTPQIRAALLLLDDEERAAELAARLDDVRRTRGAGHRPFLAWVAGRQGPRAR